MYRNLGFSASEKSDCHLATSPLSIIEEGENVALKLLRNISEDFSSLSNDVLQSVKKSNERIDVRKTKKDGENALLQYGKNLTELARRNMLDPVIGREAESERIIRILSRKTKNNPCLIGEAGVGKTAIVEGLAEKIAKGHVPDVLKEKKIITVDLTAMIAGAKYRGDFEERIKSLLYEAKNDKSIILFIDEIHTIVGAGGAEGAIDASNILKPELARAEIQLIGATTYNEYRKHIEKDAALERRFQTVTVEEPSVTAALEILRGIKGEYEKHHNLKIKDEALKAAIKLSTRYIPSKFLPDKAIDVLDESCAKVNAKSKNISENQGQNICAFDSCEGERQLTEGDVLETVEEITGIKIKGQKEGYQQIEAQLLKRVRGQEKAIRELSSAVSAAEIGLFSRERPRGIFLILGDRGSGKTLLAKELSNIIASKKSELIRYDMSEFREPSSISKLIGSPPGYVGYQDGGTLTELVRRHPYSVILFDEIEKADRDVQNLILQMLGEGIMHDSTGRAASFKDTYVIFTSNLSLNRSSQSGFVPFSEISKSLTPPRELSEEFIARMDRVVYLCELSESSLFEIGKDALNKIKERLSELGVTIEWSDELLTLFAKMAKRDKCGARSLLKIIKAFFEENVLDYLNYGSESKIYCNVKDGAPHIEFEKARVGIC